MTHLCVEFFKIFERDIFNMAWRSEVGTEMEILGIFLYLF